MHDCVHRQKLLNGIGSIIENPWQTASFSNVVTGPKSKKDDGKQFFYIIMLGRVNEKELSY